MFENRLTKKPKPVVMLIIALFVSVVLFLTFYYYGNGLLTKKQNHPVNNHMIQKSLNIEKTKIATNIALKKAHPYIYTIGMTTIDTSIMPFVKYDLNTNIFSAPIPFSKNVFGLNRAAGKVVALTFDDGPSPQFTKAYVDVLKSMNVKGTFFVIGKIAEKNPDLLKYIVQNGNEIGLHSYSHFFMPKLSPQQMADELYKTQKVIFDATNVKPTLFRPPYGAFNDTLIKISNAFGLHVVLWSVDPNDWKKPGVLNIVNRIIKNSVPGSIILMHEGKPETYAALPQVIERLKAKGYSFLTVSELMAAGKK